jgi:hypothetical protein
MIKADEVDATVFVVITPSVIVENMPLISLVPSILFVLFFPSISFVPSILFVPLYPQDKPKDVFQILSKLNPLLTMPKVALLPADNVLTTIFSSFSEHDAPVAQQFHHTKNQLIFLLSVLMLCNRLLKNYNQLDMLYSLFEMMIM